MGFCGLTKGIPQKISILCVRVIINKRCFEPFCVCIKLQLVRFSLSSPSAHQLMFEEDRGTASSGWGGVWRGGVGVVVG